MPQKYLLAPVIGLLALALAGCAAAAPADSPGDADAAPSTAPDSTTSVSEFDVVTSCDGIAAIVAPYVEGLELVSDEAFNEWGGGCTWQEPDTATDLLEVRSVEVLVSLQTGDTREGLAELATSDMLNIVDAPAVAEVGGIAHSLSFDTGVAVSVTSVLVPDVSVTVSGGKWGASGGISEADALVIAQRVLGI